MLKTTVLCNGLQIYKTPDKLCNLHLLATVHVLHCAFTVLPLTQLLGIVNKAFLLQTTGMPASTVHLKIDKVYMYTQVKKIYNDSGNIHV